MYWSVVQRHMRSHQDGLISVKDVFACSDVKPPPLDYEDSEDDEDVATGTTVRDAPTNPAHPPTTSLTRTRSEDCEDVATETTVHPSPTKPAHPVTTSTTRPPELCANPGRRPLTPSASATSSLATASASPHAHTSIAASSAAASQRDFSEAWDRFPAERMRRYFQSDPGPGRILGMAHGPRVQPPPICAPVSHTPPGPSVDVAQVIRPNTGPSSPHPSALAEVCRQLAPNDSPSAPASRPKKQSALSNARKSILVRAARLATEGRPATSAGTASLQFSARTPASRLRSRSPAALRSHSSSSNKRRKQPTSVQTGFDVVCDRIKGTLEELAVKSPPVSASKKIAHATTQLHSSFQDLAKNAASTLTDNNGSDRRRSRKHG